LSLFASRGEREKLLEQLRAEMASVDRRRVDSLQDNPIGSIRWCARPRGREREQEEVARYRHSAEFERGWLEGRGAPTRDSAHLTV
jgi:hypothetical protein